jgi:FkbM family methyltransferase
MGGVFVDVGAFDGVSLSNSYTLETEFGWSGVCVEANSDVVPALRSSRKCKVVEAAAWSHSNHLINFYRHEHPMLSGTVDFTATDLVKTMSLNDIIDLTNIGTDIDYISLDTEGTETEILSTFDMQKYNVTCWTVEHNFRSDSASWLAEYFSNHGYLFRFVKHDIFAIKER